jgi:hypothetical protein
MLDNVRHAAKSRRTKNTIFHLYTPMEYWSKIGNAVLHESSALATIHEVVLGPRIA